MPMTYNPVLDQLLIPALLVFFLVAGIVAVGLGVALIVYRHGVLNRLSAMNRWVSGRKTMAPLEITRQADPAVYKHRRWFSAAFIVGGAFAAIMIIGSLDVAAVVSLFGAQRLTFVGPWLVESFWWMLLLGSLFAVVVGIVLGFFPHALGALDARANRWYSSRQMIRGADNMYLTLDKWVAHSPRAAGVIIAVAGLIVLVNFAVVLMHRD